MGNVQITADAFDQLIIDVVALPTTTPSNGWASGLPFAKHGIRFKAPDGNTGVAYVCTSIDGTTSAKSWPLLKDQELFVPIQNPAKIFLLGSASSQTLCYMLT